MKLKEKVQALIDSGVPPIYFHLDAVQLFGNKQRLYRTLLVVNSLELGTLTYGQYRFVARRTKQGDHLVARHLEKLCRAMPQLLVQHPDALCFTVPVYARLLRDGALAKLLMETFALFPQATPEKVCIELSADILYEDMADAKERIRELRELGVKIAICEVGDEFCPVFRLAEIAFDYAFLDAFSTESLLREDADRVAGSMVHFLHFLNVKVVAPELVSEDHVASAYAVGCDGYSSEVVDREEVTLP